MNDGTCVKVDANDSFRNDEMNIIKFDEKISNKRTIHGDFFEINNTTKEFNDYYRELFEMQHFQ